MQGTARGREVGRESNVIITEAEYMDFQEMKNAVHPLQSSSVLPQIFYGPTQVLVSKT